MTDQHLDDFALADDFTLAAESAPLLPVILERIAAEGGRITFAEFMGLALGHPEYGYYSREDLAWGEHGDYETSPEVHPIFGYLWARQVLECWERLGKPAEFALVEPGAGSGAFMASILTWLRARAPECFAAACRAAAAPVLAPKQPMFILFVSSLLASHARAASSLSVRRAMSKRVS